MNTHVVIPVFASIAYLPLVSLLLANRPWERRQRLFVAFIIPAFFWSLTDSFARSNYFLDQKNLWAQIVICVAIWAVVQYHYYVLAYFRREAPRIYFAYGFLIATVALCVLGVIPTSTVVSEEGLTVHYGLALLVIAASMAFGLGVRDLVELFRCHHRSSDAAERNQVAYLIVTVAVFLVFLSASFMPTGGSFPFAHIGNLITAGVLTYAVIAHRLLDIGVFLRRGILYGTLYGTGVVVMVAVLYALRRVFGMALDVTTIGAVVAVGVPTVFLLNHGLRNPLERKVEEAFVGNRYEARQQLAAFMQRIFDVQTLEQFGRQLVSLTARSVDAKVAILLLPDSLEGDFVTRYAHPPVHPGEDARSLSIKHESPILSWLRREGQLLPVRYLSILPEFQALWKQERDDVRNAAIELFLPVANRGETVGVLAVGGKKDGRPYSVEDLDLMGSVASRVAASMEKQYLYEQLQKQERELTLLNRLASIVTSSLDLHDIFQGFSRELKKVVPLDYSAMAMVDGDQVRLRAVFGQVVATEMAEMSHPLQGTATEWVVKYRRSTYQSDLQTAMTYWPDTHYVREGIRALVHVPLIVRDQVIGTIMVASGEANAYGDEDIHLLEQVSRQIATPLENATLAPSPCSCWTSTPSRPTTTCTGIPLATSCYDSSRRW